MPSDRPGARFLLGNRFELLQMKGSGGFGRVWLAEDHVLKRSVAVKELFAGDHVPDIAERRKLALREAIALARVRHPAIVAVYDVVEDDDHVPWIVMEYVHGIPLSQILGDHGRLEDRQLAGYLLPIAQGLAVAHRARVVHRDVKPDNIMAGEDGAVSLVDFGIAQVDDTMTTSGTLKGTPLYLSPERLRGEQAGPAADMWSIGVTLYYAREGRLPFQDREEIKHRSPPPPRGDTSLSRLIMDLLHKNPAERPTAVGTAKTLADVLRMPTRMGPFPTKRTATDLPASAAKHSPRPHRAHAGPRTVAADRAMIRNVGTDAGAAMLLDMTSQRAVDILIGCEWEERRRLLRGIAAVSPRAAGDILESFGLKEAAGTLQHLVPEVGASILGAMQPESAVRILEPLIGLDVTAAAAALVLMLVPDAVGLLGILRDDLASRVFTDIARTWPADAKRMKQADGGLIERLQGRRAR
jgi:hypothetical protein